jgi:hypothetical protein
VRVSNQKALEQIAGKRLTPSSRQAGKGSERTKMQTDSTAEQAAEQPSTAQCHGMALDANNRFIRCPEFPPLHCQTGKPLLYHSDNCRDWTNQRRKAGWKLEDVYRKKKHLKYGSHYATEQQLAECRLDPAWEARQKMFYYGVCRICGALRTRIGGGKLGHIQQMHPELTLRDYHQLYPNAPSMSLNEVARDDRLATSPEQVAANLASQYVTGDEILACRADPNWETEHDVDYVVCRVCNFKSRFSIGYGKQGHLMLCHNLTWLAYQNQFPGAPRSPRAHLDKMASKGRRLYSLASEAEQLKLQVQGQPTVIRSKVKQAIQTFNRLFSLPAIKRNAVLLLDGWTHPEFSKKEIASARAAVIARARNKPVYAAIYFVSGETRMRFETVGRYHRAI